jgi:hypothetical protein
MNPSPPEEMTRTVNTVLNCCLSSGVDHDPLVAAAISALARQAGEGRSATLEWAVECVQVLYALVLLTDASKSLSPANASVAAMARDAIRTLQSAMAGMVDVPIWQQPGSRAGSIYRASTPGDGASATP